MKGNVRALAMAAFFIFLMGCQSGDEGESVMRPDRYVGSLADAKQDLTLPDDMEKLQPAPLQPEGIVWSDEETQTDIMIPFAECICEYDDGVFQIYTKLIEDRNEYFSQAGTLVYMQTPDDSIQFFTPNEYCIDYENGVFYYVGRDKYGSFENIYKYRMSPLGGQLKVCAYKLVSIPLLEEWLADTYQLAPSEGEEIFLAHRAFLTAFACERGKTVLRGEATGIYRPTRECCHIEWEINDTTGEVKTDVHVKKIYDEEEDREIFEACDKAYREKDEGNWLEPEDLKDWDSSEDADRTRSGWMRLDLNGDNLPELIGVSLHRGDPILPIEFIYTYTGGIMRPIDLVYSDLNDYSEYIYPGCTGNLVYDYSFFSAVTYGGFNWYRFDDGWQKNLVVKLELEFFDEDSYDEEEIALYKEGSPDTYGSRGAGVYCFKSVPKSGGDESELVKEEITLEEFLREYKQITGFDFFEVNPDFGHIR